MRSPLPTLDELAGSRLHEICHRLRAESPVVWLPAIDRWFVTDRSLVSDALGDAERFTVDDPRFTTALVVGPSMLSLDGEEHRRHRRPFVMPFRRSATEATIRAEVDALAVSLTRTVGEALDRGGTGAVVDLRSEVAAPLAAGAIAATLGLEAASVDDLLGWYRSIVAAVEHLTAGGDDDALIAAGSAAVAELSATVDQSIGSGTGLLAQLAADGESGLRRDELGANVAVVLFGAIETSEAMTANAFHHVLTTPGLVDRLREQPALVGRAIDESLRLEPAAAFVDRYTIRATRLGSVELPAGAPVALSLAAANRDPATFAAPDRFDLDRRGAGRHLAFASGPHACIGRRLAELQTASAIRAVLDLLDPITAAHGPAPTGLVFRKPTSIPVTAGGGRTPRETTVAG